MAVAMRHVTIIQNLFIINAYFKLFTAAKVWHDYVEILNFESIRTVLTEFNGKVMLFVDESIFYLPVVIITDAFDYGKS